MKTKPRHFSRGRLDPSTIILFKQIGLGLFWLSVLGVIIAVIYFGTRINSVTMNEVEVSGGITINKDYVKQVVEGELSGTYFGLIPKRFIYAYPENLIKNAVLAIPRSKDVNIKRSGRTVIVSFEEYVPEALWCSTSKPEECLFLDNIGYGFAIAPSLFGGSLLRYFVTGHDIVPKTTPFSLADFEATQKFSKLLEEINWFVETVEISDVGDVFYSIAQGGEIKTTLTEDQSKPFDNLKTILNSKEFNHIKPGNFQYIDLRFGTRVFVNEELPTSVATTTATTTVSEILEE